MSRTRTNSPDVISKHALSAVFALLFLSLAANIAAHTLPLSYLRMVPDADYLHLELTFNPFELTFFSELDANKDRRLDSSEWEAPPSHAIRRIVDCLKVSVNGEPVSAEVAGIIPDFDSHHATLRAHYAVDARHGVVTVVSSLAALTSGSHFTQVTFSRESGAQSARLDAHSAAVTFGKTDETGEPFPPVRERALAARFFPAVLLALGALLGFVWVVGRGMTRPPRTVQCTSEKALLGSTSCQPVPSGDSPDGTGEASQGCPGTGFPFGAVPIPLGEPPTGAGGSPAPPVLLTRSQAQTHPPTIESRKTS